MINKYNFILEYRYNGEKLLAYGNETEHYVITAAGTENFLKIDLIPKVKIELINAYLEYNYNYTSESRVYVNGYQSWTTSREYKSNDTQKGLMGLSNYKPIRNLTAIFGDYNFQQYSLVPGKFHSYSYTYINDLGNINLFGTLNERTGYTVFHHDMPSNILTVQKDVEGVTIEASYEIFNIYHVAGEYNAVFDEYFTQLNLPKLKHKHLAGYTSWYNYYGGISEKILSRDIDGLATLGDKVDIFQIDDGYQIAVGDWLTLKDDLFPSGMKFLVDKVHSKGYKAGLWMAPFNAQRSSEVAKKHRDWLVKIPGSNKPQLGCIGWGGAYTLDFYNKDAAAYIKSCFDGVFDDWGFDMVKLDFLYSICLTPRYNKSRGQIMCEAMDFLRECVRDKLLLGCGVPLFPALGKVDMCRISCDVGASFEDPFYLKHTNQEIISTKNAMNNTIFRRHLDGRAFINDPDVFYMRGSNLVGVDPLISKKGRLKFTEKQKLLLAEVNNMCGNVLFVSDNVGGYDDTQRENALKTFAATDKVVLDAEYTDTNQITVVFSKNDRKFKLVFDTITGENTTIEL